MDIMGIIATGLSVALGVTMVWNKVDKVLNALRELAEVLTAITAALADKEVTKEELANIKKEALEALAAFKAIIK